MTIEYFPRHSLCRDGLDVQCKKCKANHRELNKERKAVTIKVWQQANRDKIAACQQNRRALKAGAPSTLTSDDLARIRTDQGNGGYFCAESFEIVVETVDHLTPLTREGTSNWPENIALACGPCNTSKGNKTEAEFWIYLEVNGRMPEIGKRRRANVVPVGSTGVHNREEPRSSLVSPGGQTQGEG